MGWEGGEEGEGETGRIDVKSSGDLRRNGGGGGGGGSANRLLPIRPNTVSTNPRRIFEFSIPGNSSGIVNGPPRPV